MSNLDKKNGNYVGKGDFFLGDGPGLDHFTGFLGHSSQIS
jgi:hypothetical protein